MNKFSITDRAKTFKKFQFLEKTKGRKIPLIARLSIAPDTLKKEDYTVQGNLKLTYFNQYKLPEGFVINGNLDISDSSIIKLPNNLTVTGELWFRRTDIKTIPLTVKIGTLMMNRTKMTKLPDNLTLGNLIVEYSSLNALPNNLTLTENLYLSDQRIKAWPSNLKIGHNLIIMLAKSAPDSLVKLPDDLVVKNKIGIHTYVQYKRERLIEDFKRVNPKFAHQIFDAHDDNFAEY